MCYTKIRPYLCSFAILGPITVNYAVYVLLIVEGCCEVVLNFCVIWSTENCLLVDKPHVFYLYIYIKHVIQN